MNTRTQPQMSSVASCGHPSSLEVKSVESAYRACELCEARTAQRDAEAMERKYRAELDDALQRLKIARRALGNEHGFECRSLKAPMSDKHGPCDCGAGSARAILAAVEGSQS